MTTPFAEPSPPAANSPLSPYLQQVAPADAISEKSEYHWFVGLDLAPNERLETGLALLDKDRTLFQADKIISDSQIISFIRGLAPKPNQQVLVAIDAPKSLSLETKWQQERVRLHAHQLKQPVIHSESEQPDVVMDRFSERMWFLADELTELGATVVITVDAIAKERYGLAIPFRGRSPQGCRALQHAIKKHLCLGKVPKNIVPSSVLDAMITAFTAWLCAHGNRGEHIEIYTDSAQRLFAEPLS